MNNGYEEKQKILITGNTVAIWQKFNRGNNVCVNNVQECRAHSWTLKKDDRHDVTKKKSRIWLLAVYVVVFVVVWGAICSCLRPADNENVLEA